MGRYRDGLLDAAKIAEAMSKKSWRQAVKFHNAEEPDYERYESLECEACLLQSVADKIKRKAK